MCKLFFKIIVMATLLMLFADAAAADIAPVPSVIHYQAHLMNAAGVNFEGDVSAEVWIYDSPIEGVEGDLNCKHLVYAERQSAIHVDRGTLRLSIGEGAALGRFAGAPLPLERLAEVEDVFIELYLNGEKIEPRQHIGYNSYALRAQYARRAENLDGSFSIPASSLPDLNAAQTEGVLAPVRIPPMGAERISGTLSADRISPTLTLDKIVSGTLSEAIIEGINSSAIDSEKFSDGVLGDVMHSGNFYMEHGDAGHLGSVSYPSGFTYSQCHMIAGLKMLDMPSGQMADDLFIEVIPGSIWTGLRFTVQCEAEYQYQDLSGCLSGGPCGFFTARHPCITRYLMLCSK